MTQAEVEYKELVEPDGYEKALNTFCTIEFSFHPTITNEVRDQLAKLYWLTLVNAFLRGENAGVRKAREAFAEAKAKGA